MALQESSASYDRQTEGTKVIEVPLRISSEKSRILHEEARRYAPGGVHGGARYYQPYPLYIEKAEGARIWDVDGNEYIDYHAAYGPAVLGHNEPRVRQAVIDALQREGVLFAQSHPREVALCRTFTEIIPYAEKTALHSGGGSDPLYNAVRLARAYTGRKKIAKFEGGYHGWHDELAISVRPSPADAGPSEAPCAVAGSAGALREHADNTVILPLNDEVAVERTIARQSHEIAGLFIEPVVHSCGCLLLKPGFLQFLRQICDAHGIVLVFDEVITGFRHSLQGAGAQLGVHPDIAAFGKGMLNGFTGSALTGRSKVMSLMGPEGSVLFGGTFAGHLLSVVACQTTIEIMRTEPVHQRLFHLGNMLSEGINKAIRDTGVRAVCYNYGSVWSLYLSVTEVQSYRAIIHIASGKYSAAHRAYRNHLQNNGVFLMARQPIRGFISYAHSEDDIQKTIDLTAQFFRENAAALQ